MPYRLRTNSFSPPSVAWRRFRAPRLCVSVFSTFAPPMTIQSPSFDVAIESQAETGFIQGGFSYFRHDPTVLLPWYICARDQCHSSCARARRSEALGPLSIITSYLDGFSVQSQLLSPSTLTCFTSAMLKRWNESCLERP